MAPERPTLTGLCSVSALLGGAALLPKWASTIILPAIAALFLGFLSLKLYRYGLQTLTVKREEELKRAIIDRRRQQINQRRRS